MKLKIKKGSTVQVITGSSKGRKGKVLEINPMTMQVKVEGAGLKTHFDKEKGLEKREGFIHYSNVKLVD